MSIDDLKEVQAKTNKMISKRHFKDKCCWISNQNLSNSDNISPKEINSSSRNKEEYLSLLSKEIKLLFISKDFTNKEKKHIYEVTTEAFWQWKIKSQKK